MIETWPGDGTFKRAVQQAQLSVPRRNGAGKPQAITFPPLADVPAETASAVPLGATSNAGLPVHYFVDSGPAEVAGDAVKLLPVPARATYPVTVTIVAWQWGRSGEPKVQTAAPVARTFRITRGR